MISSTSNPQMKYLRQLMSKAKLRRQEGVFVAEGIHMVQEAPAGQITAVYCSESFAAAPEHQDWIRRLEPEMVSDPVFQSISDAVTPQGILALVKIPVHTVQELSDSGKPLLLLESLQDPGNLGTILRTGEGAGIGGVIMNRTTVDLYNPKTVRSTQGSLYRVPCVITEDLATASQILKEAGYRIYAAHLKGQHFYTEETYTSRTAFLIGNEGNGLTPETTSLADRLIRIPMEGKVESLNAGVAASLLVYEVYRQKRQGVSDDK